jgi:hypothetical protein
MAEQEMDGRVSIPAPCNLSTSESGQSHQKSLSNVLNKYQVLISKVCTVFYVFFSPIYPPYGTHQPLKKTTRTTR